MDSIKLSEQASKIMGATSYDYFAGGAGDESTLQANEEQWDKIKLSPRNLIDVSNLDTSVELLGKRRANPFVVAPMAYQKHAHPLGELGSSGGAAATDTIFTLSTQSTTPLEDVAAKRGDASQWFQLYVFRDRAVSLDMVQKAKDLGYEALVITIDFPVGGIRERDRRNGFQVKHPVAINPGGGALTPKQLHDLHDPTMTWEDIALFSEKAGMPVIMKGVLRADEAVKAMEHGARGIVVSNHGGRQLDTVPATLQVLPSIVDAVGEKCDILVDGGVRRGWDAAKALALGANGVMVGRPVLWGLASGGEEGAAEVLTKFQAEFANTLALLGVPRAQDLTKDALFFP